MFGLDAKDINEREKNIQAAKDKYPYNDGAAKIYAKMLNGENVTSQQRDYLERVDDGIEIRSTTPKDRKTVSKGLSVFASRM